jgi:hypothetical protein
MEGSDNLMPSFRVPDCAPAFSRGRLSIPIASFAACADVVSMPGPNIKIQKTGAKDAASAEAAPRF